MNYEERLRSLLCIYDKLSLPLLRKPGPTITRMFDFSRTETQPYVHAKRRRTLRQLRPNLPRTALERPRRS